MIIIVIYVFLIFLWGSFKIDCFQSFIEGARSGMNTAVKILPTIFALVFGVNLFVHSGIIDYLHYLIQHPVLVPELFLQAFLKPISGNSSLVLMELIYQKYQPDSLSGKISSILQGCTDTTIYVVTIYFGSLKLRSTKGTMAIALVSDLIVFLLLFIGVIIFF